MQVSESHGPLGLIQTFSEYNHDEWLQLRHQDVTASKVGALFDVHPYSSPLQLYAEKVQLNPNKIADNGVLRRGRWFEAAAIKAARELRPNWVIEEPGIYVRDAENRIGATPDATIIDEHGELGVMQVKTVAKKVFREEWRDSSGNIEVPFWITLQTYTEATLLNMSKGVVAALVCDEFDPELHIVEFDCPNTTYNRIIRETNRFWEAVQDRSPPAADYTKDLRAMAELYTGAGPIEDFTGNLKFEKLLDEQAAIKARLKSAEEDAEHVKARVIEALGNAEAALCGNRFVTFKQQTRAAHAVKESTFRVLRVGTRETQSRGKKR